MTLDFRPVDASSTVYGIPEKKYRRQKTPRGGAEFCAVRSASSVPFESLRHLMLRACTRAPVRPRATVRISQGFGTTSEPAPKKTHRKRPKLRVFSGGQTAVRIDLFGEQNRIFGRIFQRKPPVTNALPALLYQLMLRAYTWTGQHRQSGQQNANSPAQAPAQERLAFSLHAPKIKKSEMKR